MIYKRFVFKLCGVGIQWFATIKEFIHIILGAVQGHESALDLEILHRDISGPNVMIGVKNINKECTIPNDQKIRDGFLADWGLAIDLREKELKSRDPHLHTRTGTYPYLSMELMFSTDGQSVKHRACDDLELFFWILWVMLVNYTGPFNQTRNWEYIEHLMITLAC
ncbi:hypothetical protein DFH29DRAFT_998721 [Suillus ampliporus]|nr:hypothetical protein DFH29DRAFT_998721 [Suillus ampliporus]